VSLTHDLFYNRLTVCGLVWIVGLVCGWLPWIGTGQAKDAAVTITLTSTPAFEHIRPNMDLARVTLTTFFHGQPLGQGHIKIHLTAPPRTKVMSTGFPRVEGSALLALDSVLTDGSLTIQYLFPIRGTYALDLEIAPVPGGPVFQPTSLHKTLHIAENPAVVRNAWMLIIGLFALGGVTGVIFARSTAAREKLLSSASIGPLVLLNGALVPVSFAWADASHTHTVAAVAHGPQIIRGEDGWELEIRASPMPATVGQLVQFAIWLRKDDTVFPGMTDVAIAVVNQEDAQTVLGTHLLAPQGHTLQSLQFYDGAPHAVTITARPVGGEVSTVAPLTAVLGLDVVALHPPMAVKIRMMAILLGVFVVGMALGFFVPWPSQEQAGA